MFFSRSQKRYAAGEISRDEFRRLKKRHDWIVRNRLFVACAVFILFISWILFSGDSSKKSTGVSATPANLANVPSIQPADLPTTTSVLQRIEATMSDFKNTFTKGLANLNSRVEVLEKKPPSTLPPVATIPQPVVVDLTLVERGLNKIADRLPSSAPAIVQMPAPQPLASERASLSDEERARRYWEQYQRSYDQP